MPFVSVWNWCGEYESLKGNYEGDMNGLEQ